MLTIGRSTQLKPEGVSSVKGTGSHRTTETAFVRSMHSQMVLWGRKTRCESALTWSGPAPPPWHFPVTFSGCPNVMPASASFPGTGDREMVHLPSLHGRSPCTKAIARYMFPPFTGSPSTAVHGRSRSLLFTESQENVNVAPWSSDRATALYGEAKSLPLCAPRSLK